MLIVLSCTSLICCVWHLHVFGATTRRVTGGAAETLLSNTCSVWCERDAHAIMLRVCHVRSSGCVSFRSQVRVKLARRTEGIPGVPSRPEPPLEEPVYSEVDVSMRREAVALSPVYGTLLPSPSGKTPPVGYVRLSQFSGNAAQEMKRAIQQLKVRDRVCYHVSLAWGWAFFRLVAQYSFAHMGREDWGLAPALKRVWLTGTRTWCLPVWLALKSAWLCL